MANAAPRNPRRRGRRRLPGVVGLALCLAVLLAPPTSAAPAPAAAGPAPGGGNPVLD